MKASKAIEYLSKLDPNEEIIIEWWDRNFTKICDEDGNELVVSVDVWDFVVKQMGAREHLMDMYNELVIEQINDQYERTNK